MSGCTRPPPELQIVDYADVCSPTSELSSPIEKSFGPGGLGVIAIRNIPNFVTSKQALLPQAHTLAHLPKEELEKLEDGKSLYNAGWSHGKEKVSETTYADDAYLDVTMD